MGKLTITGIDRSFLQYKDAFFKLSSLTQIDSLNSFLLYNREGNTLRLISKEANSSFVQVQIPATVSQEGIDTNIGIMMGFVPFFIALESVPDNLLSDLVIEITVDEPSSMKLFWPNRRYNLIHRIITSEQVEELLLLAKEYETVENPAFQLDLFNDDKEDFLNGISDCSNFLSATEEVNNAFALFNNKVTVNNRQHVFIYNYNNPVVFIQEAPLSLHKKAAKFFLILRSKGIPFDVLINKDHSKVIILALGFQAVLNNSMSNILPPSEEDLNEIRATKHIWTVPSKTLIELSDHLQLFFSSSSDMSPITLFLSSKGIKFAIRNTISDQTMNLVDIDYPFETEKAEIQEFVITITNVSFNDFLKNNKGLDIEIYADVEHKAVYLKSIKREIYMAKLV